MHSTQKGRRLHFGMKLRIGVDEETGLTHSLDRTPANRSDVGMAGALPRGGEERVSGDAGCQEAGKRPENEGLRIDWKIATGRGKRKTPGKGGPEEAGERRKASVRAGVGHPFRWLKRCFGRSKARCRELYRNRRRMAVLLGVTNLTMAGRHAAAWPGTIASEERALGREEGCQDANSSESDCFRGGIPDSGLTVRRRLF